MLYCWDCYEENDQEYEYDVDEWCYVDFVYYGIVVIVVEIGVYGYGLFCFSWWCVR